MLERDQVVATHCGGPASGPGSLNSGWGEGRKTCRCRKKAGRDDDNNNRRKKKRLDGGLCFPDSFSVVHLLNGWMTTRPIWGTAYRRMWYDGPGSLRPAVSCRLHRRRCTRYLDAPYRAVCYRQDQTLLQLSGLRHRLQYQIRRVFLHGLSHLQCHAC